MDDKFEKVLRMLPDLEDVELIALMNSLADEFQTRFMVYAGELRCNPDELPPVGCSVLPNN